MTYYKIRHTVNWYQRENGIKLLVNDMFQEDTHDPRVEGFRNPIERVLPEVMVEIYLFHHRILFGEIFWRLL